MVVPNAFQVENGCWVFHRHHRTGRPQTDGQRDFMETNTRQMILVRSCDGCLLSDLTGSEDGWSFAQAAERAPWVTKVSCKCRHST